jgi:hypothetical protein
VRHGSAVVDEDVGTAVGVVRDEVAGVRAEGHGATVRRDRRNLDVAARAFSRWSQTASGAWNLRTWVALAGLGRPRRRDGVAIGAELFAVSAGRGGVLAAVDDGSPPRAVASYDDTTD